MAKLRIGSKSHTRSKNGSSSRGHCWPKAIDSSLWPAALKNYANLRNSLPSDFVPGINSAKDKYEGSPVLKMLGVEIDANLCDFHPFGSPVYVLENALQSQSLHSKWLDSSRVGIFLTHLPEHTLSVPLILNTQTGKISPHFHCIYDDALDTCRRDAKFESLWQRKAKLGENARIPTDPMQRPISVINSQIPIIPQFIFPWDHQP